MQNCRDNQADYSTDQLAFPCLWFNRTNEKTRKEFRFDYPVRVTLAGDVNVASNLIAGNVYNDVWNGQDHCNGRLTAEKVFDDNGTLHEISYFSYDDEGNSEWTIKQFDKTEIRPAGTGEQVHKISYPEYDLQGKLLTENIDLRADGKLDFQRHYEYDGFGRLQTVYANRQDLKELGNKIVEYTYNDTLNLVARTRYFARSKDCPAHKQVDEIAYHYDRQGRLDSLRSELFDFDLFYDDADPNSPSAYGAERVQYHENFNGAINGWRAGYKVEAHGVSDFVGATVYGFSYDGLNRLTDADATVFENKIQSPISAPVSGYNPGGAYGVKINQTRTAWYGDARYAFDKAGNLTGLRRYHYFAPSNPPAPGAGPSAPVKGDNYIYEYFSGTNRLQKLRTNGTPGINLSYDANGNLKSDSKRGIQGMAYNASNLPESFTKSGGTRVDYIYGAGDQRVHKIIATPGNGSKEQYYFRDGAGKTIAILDKDLSGTVGSGGGTNADFWTFEIQGNGLVAEWAVRDSVIRDTSNNSGGGASSRLAPEPPKKGRKFLKKLAIHLAAALPVVATNMAMSPKEGQAVRPERAATVAMYPLFVELLTRVFGKPDADSLELPELRNGIDSTRNDTILNGIKFFVKDHLGNVRVAYQPEVSVHPTTGGCDSIRYRIASVMDYFPYGKHLRSFFESEPERYQTTEHERDAESGLDYRGARYYDSEYARFTGVDPLAGKFAGWSPYNYVIGNPVSLVDPDGMAPGGPEGGDEMTNISFLLTSAHVSFANSMVVAYPHLFTKIDYQKKEIKISRFKVEMAGYDEYGDPVYQRGLDLIPLQDFKIGDYIGDIAQAHSFLVSPGGLDPTDLVVSKGGRVPVSKSLRDAGEETFERIRGRKPKNPINWHHLIPFKLKDHPLMRKSIQGGFEFESFVNNLEPLERYLKINGLGQHNGGHMLYSNAIEIFLNKVQTNFPSLSPGEAAEFLKSVSEGIRETIRKTDAKLDEIDLSDVLDF